MLNESTVSKHYTHGSLLDAIQASVAKLGKTTDSITVEDLAPVDEFHIGSRFATDHLLGQLQFSAGDHILDVGCGLGGASRYVASRYSNRVTGIDLTPEFIETGKVLCTWVGLENRVTLHQGSALAMPFADESFDGAIMLHVGMNIDDKARLFGEVSRVLRPGAAFGIYDVMRVNDGDLAYPVPWATEHSTSALATPDQYKKLLDDASFEVSTENNRRAFALEFFNTLQEKMKANGGPPPLGLHVLMRESTPIKIKNMLDNIAADRIAPVEIIARKR